MFTGIVEETGTIRSWTTDGKMVISASKVLEGTAVGDSIAVSGVCLTVTDFNKDSFAVDVMPETLRRSSLEGAKPGLKVNLERAMAADGRFGGHMVSGHIDGTAKLASVRSEGNARIISFSANDELLRYMVPKGSVAVDGISLTIADLVDSGFLVSIIPHTMAETTLNAKQAGDLVNIEVDIIAKYIERFFNRTQGSAGSDSSILEALNRAGYEL